ncbi:trophoblast glycoprotein-like [Brevipalpus obovatus]|uniref:trophoblast glycoprotein-like n=1 Tax=Brevipalpus obovatus TaxID=246614 RepID=UPI003D9FA986
MCSHHHNHHPIITTMGLRLHLSSFILTVSIIYLLTVKVNPIFGEDSVSVNCPILLKNCSCGHQTYRGTDATYITNCTDTGITDPLVLRDISQATEALIFTGNFIHELPPNIFGIPDKSKEKHEALKQVNMSHNYIRKVHGKSFHEVSSVVMLDLSNNQILITGDEYHPRFFTNFGNLEELYLDNAFGDIDRSDNFMEDLMSMIVEAKPNRLRILSLKYNRIKRFPRPSTLCELPSLQKLMLNGNNITDIGIDLSCNTRLRYLDLSNNKITSLDNQTLHRLSPMSPTFHIDLRGNPFHCDCELREFINWISNAPFFVTGKLEYRCATGYPESLINRTLLSLSPYELECDHLSSSVRHGYFSITYVILVICIFISTFLLIGLVYQNRNILFTSCTKSWAEALSKRQYTSLEKDDPRVTREVEEVAV